MNKICYLTESVKGDAVFLDRAKAEEYAAKHNGVVYTMLPKMIQDEQETPNHSPDIQQTGAAVVERSKLLLEDSPDYGTEFCGSGPAPEAVLACGSRRHC